KRTRPAPRNDCGRRTASPTKRRTAPAGTAAPPPPPSWAPAPLRPARRRAPAARQRPSGAAVSPRCSARRQQRTSGTPFLRGTFEPTGQARRYRQDPPTTDHHATDSGGYTPTVWFSDSAGVDDR